MTPTDFRQLQWAVFERLREPADCSDLSSLRALFPGVSAEILEKALQGLRASGLITYAEALGPDGVGDIELTARGLAFEPGVSGAAQVVNIHGGNVQIGDNNRQEIGGPWRRR